MSVKTLTKIETLDNDVSNIVDGEQYSADDTMDPKHTNEIIEEIKSRILRNLSRTEPPVTHAPLPLLQTLIFEEEFERNATWDTSSIRNTGDTRAEIVHAEIGEYYVFRI